MNVLVIDRAPPCDLHQGNALIGYHVFRRLRRRHRLTLVCPALPEQHAAYQAALAELFDRIWLMPRQRPVHGLTGVVEGWLMPLPLEGGRALETPALRAMYRRVRQALAHEHFDVVHVRQLPMAAIGARLRHPARLLELVDAETLQAWRRLTLRQPRTWARLPLAAVVERWALRRFAACTTVAEADARVLRRLAPGVPVQVIPNGVDADYFRPLDLPEEPNTLIFTGGMSFPPNVTAVLFFYHQILPLIRRAVPEVRLVIAGKDPAPAVQALAADPAVTVTGYLDDLRPWLARASVMVCPMRSGSGIKNKVLEALAMARPVVTTTLGAEALAARHGHELLIADAPAAFAAAVVALLRDPARRRQLGQAGRALVTQRYSWEACAAAYDRMYARLAASRPLPAALQVLHDDHLQ